MILFCRSDIKLAVRHPLNSIQSTNWLMGKNFQIFWLKLIIQFEWKDLKIWFKRYLFYLNSSFIWHSNPNRIWKLDFFKQYTRVRIEFSLHWKYMTENSCWTTSLTSGFIMFENFYFSRISLVFYIYYKLCLIWVWSVEAIKL